MRMVAKLNMGGCMGSCGRLGGCWVETSARHTRGSVGDASGWQQECDGRSGGRSQTPPPLGAPRSSGPFTRPQNDERKGAIAIPHQDWRRRCDAPIAIGEKMGIMHPNAHTEHIQTAVGHLGPHIKRLRTCAGNFRATAQLGSAPVDPSVACSEMSSSLSTAPSTS
eukprot:194754-Chlamydomonas_euryale.AAC.7